MPRGGKRPGAGAPKGNVNRATDAFFMANMHLIHEYLEAHPHKQLFAQEALQAGLFRLTPQFEQNVSAHEAAAFLYRHMTEFPHQSNTIKETPRCPNCTPPDPPPPDSNPPAAANQTHPPDLAEKTQSQSNSPPLALPPGSRP